MRPSIHTINFFFFFFGDRSPLMYETDGPSYGYRIGMLCLIHGSYEKRLVITGKQNEATYIE